MPGLPPGNYKLFAWESIESDEYLDGDFLRPYEDRGKPVHIEDGHQQSVQLELISAEDRPH